MQRDQYTELFKMYQSSLFLYLYRMCGSKEIAEELVQETFFRAMVSMKTAHHEYARAWLYKVARHLFVDWYRKHRVEVQMRKALKSEEKDTTYPTPEEALELNERKIRVAQAMSRLPEQYRTILLLREMHELSYSELSEVLDLNLNQVKVTLHRARARFKTEMDQSKGDS